MLHIIYNDGTTKSYRINEIGPNFDGTKLLLTSPNITSVLLEGKTKIESEILFSNIPSVNGNQVWYFGDMAKFVACNLIGYLMKSYN